MLKNKLSPSQIILFTFGLMILAGMALLMLPLSTVKGGNNWIDALFISTSAICVTGLTVVDISADYTFFGQLVLLVLIQAGGLGIIILSVFFLEMFRRRMTLGDDDMIDPALIYTPEPDKAVLLRKIVLAVLIIEAAGAAILALEWSRVYPTDKAVYYGIFHSISGFCNAGFTLFPDNMEGFKTNPVINLVLMALLVAGSLGFIVLMDIRNLFFRRKRTRFRDISTHSKMVFTTTFFLAVAGALVFYFLERTNVLNGVSLADGLLISLFQSVTRTCGFNTVPVARLTDATCFLFIILMFIGGAPGSTAGGIKVTAFGIITALAISRLRGQEEVSVFYRTIPREIVSKALMVAISSMFFIVVIFFLLLLTETGSMSLTQERGVFEVLLFEAVSAFCTVGLSMGITPDLTPPGKLLIIFSMFIGRIGPLTLALAMASNMKKKGRFRYARGDLMVG